MEVRDRDLVLGFDQSGEIWNSVNTLMQYQMK